MGVIPIDPRKVGRDSGEDKRKRFAAALELARKLKELELKQLKKQGFSGEELKKKLGSTSELANYLSAVHPNDIDKYMADKQRQLEDLAGRKKKSRTATDIPSKIVGALESGFRKLLQKKEEDLEQSKKDQDSSPKKEGEKKDTPSKRKAIERKPTERDDRPKERTKENSDPKAFSEVVKKSRKISESKQEFSKEVQRLHFEEGLSQQEVADKLGVNVHTVYRQFKKDGLTPRVSTKKIDLDSQEVKKLYDSGLTQKEVAEQLGVSESTIYRHFKKYDIKPHRIGTRDEVDSKEVQKLHYKEKLNRKEISEKLEVSERTISRIYRDEGLEARGQTKYHNESERELARKENRKKTQMKVIETREKLFGKECQICTEERRLAIHRKDGAEHNPDDLWKIEYLRTVNPDEYAAVCIPCHNGVHWRMRTYGQNWEQIKSEADMKPHLESKIRKPLDLPNETVPSSQVYLEMKSGFEGSEEELRRAIFGENCHFCGSRYDKKQLYLHRKDGRPHHSDLTSKEKYFRTLEPKEWVFLCYSDHRGVHWEMNTFDNEWDDLIRK